MTGLLNVYKPSGPTSHDVVARLRRLLGTRRVGHSGTLDPLADGVLLIAAGPATRLLEYLNDLPKRYAASLRFGLVTDTQDITGTVLEERDAGGLTREQVETAAAGFAGALEQVPPMYSAVKVGGQPLYERARRGEIVERAARRITIYRLEVTAFRPGPAPEAEIDVECSSGTYVRTLGHDLGAALGPGATMTRLTRTAIGPFRIEAALSPDDLAQRQAAGEPLPWIAPLDAVAHLPVIRVDADQALALRQGRAIPVPDASQGKHLALLDAAGQLVAIGRSEGAIDGFRVAPEKVFPDSEPAG
jgi:tRNA pseudouridine55 synthase